MKRNMILAVVVIVALSLAGMGGVFATWSDSETSYNNTIETGAVDLKVNGQDDEPWGEGVPSKVDIECMIPCKWYGGYEVELWHAGQCTENATAYIHFKNMECGNVEPKENPYPDNGSEWWYLYHYDDPNYPTTGYPDPVSGELKPEPELVAEYGGWVDCTYVPGVGVQGDTCTMMSNVEVAVTSTNIAYDQDVIIEATNIGALNCTEIELFDLTPCNARTIYLWFHLMQYPEEYYGHNFFLSPAELGLEPGDDGYDEALLHWQKFNDWPSWALMKDMVTFDLEFDLYLEDP